MKLTTKQIKQIIKEEIAAVQEMYGPSPGWEGGNDPMQAMYQQGYQDAKASKLPQPHMSNNNDYMQGYQDGSDEMEGEVEPSTSGVTTFTT